MARPKTEYRNEVKTRVSDPVYEAVQSYIEKHGYASEARGISDLLELALFGVIGSVPTPLQDFRPGLGQFGTKTPA